jgi:hypothetical protein
LRDLDNLAKLLIAFGEADDTGGGKATKPLARTAFGYLARGLAPEAERPVGRLKPAETTAILTGIPVRGFLSGDDKMVKVTETIREQALACGILNQDTINSYTHGARRVFAWGLGKKLPLLEKAAKEAGFSGPQVKRRSPEANEVLAKHYEFRYFLHSDRWPEGPREIFTGFMKWTSALVSEEREKRNIHKDTTNGFYEECLARYIGYLVNVAKVLKLPGQEGKGVEFTRDSFLAALQNRQWLMDFANWYGERQQKVRPHKKNYVPIPVRHTLTCIAVLVRRYWYPVILRKKIAGERVMALKVLKEGKRHTFLKDNTAIIPTIAEVLEIADKLDVAADRRSAPLARAKMRQVATLLRVLVFIPLRKRAWIEMRLGAHLFHDKDGWHARIPPELIKTEAEVALDMPAYLWPYLDSYTAPGGPRDVILATKPRNGRKPEPDMVFPGEGGVPISENVIYRAVRDWIFTFSDMRITFHQMRDVCATSHLSRDPREVIMVSHLLADTVEAVVEHYSHVTHKQSVARAGDIVVQEWLPGAKKQPLFSLQQIEALAAIVPLTPEQRKALAATR